MTSSFRSLALALLVIPTLAAAAEKPAAPGAGSPQALLAPFMDALRTSDWPKASGMIHPDALDEARKVFLQLAASDPTGDVGKQLFALKEGEKLDALPPREVFTRFMVSLVGQTPGLRELLASTRSEALGQVGEGPMTHVVYRLTRTAPGEAPFTQVEVLTFKKAGAEWRSMLPSEVEGVLATIRNSMAQRDAMLKQQQDQLGFPQLDLGTNPAPAPPPPPPPQP